MRALGAFNMKIRGIPMRILSILITMVMLGATFSAQGAVNSTKSAEYVEEAMEFLQKGNLNAAVIQMKNAVAADLKNANNRQILAGLYMRQQKPAFAEKEYLKAVELGYKKSDISIGLAKAYLLQRKFDLVLALLTPENVNEADQDLSFLISGQAHQGMGDLDKALASFLKAENISKDNDVISVAIAQLHFFKKENEKAAEKLDQGLAINPKNIKGLILKGEMVLAEKGAKDALPYFEHVLEIEPENMAAMVKNAGVLFDLKRDEEALVILDRIFEVAPRHPFANYLSAVIQVRKGDNKKAMEFLETAGPALDNFVPALMLRGVVNYSEGNYAQAVHGLSKLIDITPENVVGRRYLGAALLRQGEHQEAIDVLEPALEYGDAGSIIYALLGSANMKLGKYEKGTEYFAKAVEANPDAERLKTQLALSKLASGDPQSAVENLEGILEKDPNSKQAAVFLTLISLRQQDFEKALENADHIIAQSKDNPIGYNLKGTAYAGLGRSKEARENFDRALDLNPEYHSANINLAQLALRENNEKEAIDIYQKILRSDKKHVGAKLGLVKIARSKRDYKTAVQYLEQAADAAPKRIDIRVQLSEIYLLDKDLEKAKDIAVQIIRDFPDHGAGYEAAGKIDMLLGNNDLAIGNLKRMAAILGENDKAYQLLGNAQMKVRDYEGARQTFQKALKFAKNKEAFLSQLYSLESREGNYPAARKYIEDLKKMDEKSPLAYVLEGRLFMVERKPQDALNSYKKAREFGAKSTRFAIEYSRAYAAMGDKENATKILTDWLARNEKNLNIRHVLASDYLQAGSYTEAIEQYDYILNIDANNVVALNNNAWLYSKVGEMAKAEIMAEKSYKMRPEVASFMDTYAWILVQAGKNKQGLDLLQKAVNKEPDNMDIRYHFAVALKNNGNTKAAKKELEQMISSGVEFSEAENARKMLREMSQ